MDGAIGTVGGCSHQYHDKCIIQWSNHSNSCPTCRKPFHEIIQTTGTTKTVVRVQDRLMPNTAIDDIPEEYIIRALAPPQPPDPPPQGVCVICASADYRRSRRTVACTLCASVFHHHCLGLGGVDEWHCPICDGANQVPRAPPSLIRVLARRTRRAEAVEPVVPESFDDFVVRRPNVLNGGVRLRREMIANQNLSPDEALAWSHFDAARLGTELTEAPSPSAPPRRRRRRAVQREQGVTQDAPKQSTQEPRNSQAVPGTRIASLMSQIRNQPRTEELPVKYPQPSHVSNNLPSPPNQLPSQSPVFSENRLGDSGGSDTEPELVPKPPGGLSLQQKTEIQKHIRNRLRPLYRTKGTAIATESDYIAINKRVSRKLYGVVEASHLADEAKLRELVNEYVDRELL